MPTRSPRWPAQHLIALAARTGLLAGADERMFVDIDSLLRPVYGHHKQGASFGHAKIAGRALLRKGLSPLITTLSRPSSGAGDRRGVAARRQDRLRARRRPPAQAGDHHRPSDRPDATIMARGDSAFGTKKVIGACLDEQVEFSLTLSRNRRVTKAIEAIDDDAWTPVHYPGAVEDPDTGALISDAEVAETPYTLTVRGHGRVTARLVVRRVKDARYPDALFPVWRYHPFFTNSDLPTTEADITHRKHAIVETTFADLIDGPLAHIPSGLFAANCAWLACAVIAHNLLRAAGTLAGGEHAVARGATLRRDLVNVPARFAAPARKPMLHLPAHWPWQIGWKTLWDNIIGHSTRPINHAQDDRHRPCPPAIPGPTREPATRKSWYRPADHSCASTSPTSRGSSKPAEDRSKSPIRRVARGNRTPGLPQIPYVKSPVIRLLSP